MNSRNMRNKRHKFTITDVIAGNILIEVDKTKSQGKINPCKRIKKKNKMKSERKRNPNSHSIQNNSATTFRLFMPRFIHSHTHTQSPIQNRMEKINRLNEKRKKKYKIRISFTM